MIGLVGMTLLIAAVLLAPVLAPIDPVAQNYDALLQPLSREHWFGTDDLGRDIYSRVLWGGRDSLRVGFSGLVISVVGGIILGLISGYYGGWPDSLLMRLVDIWLAFPAILLLLSIVAALGPGLTTIIIAIGISTIPTFGRLVRGSVLAAKNYEYVVAARIIGARNGRIMFRHILPNITGVLIIYAILGLGSFVLLSAGLTFLGLGTQPPSPEWGAMLNAGRSYLRDAWWLSVFPGLAIFIAVLWLLLRHKT